VSTSAAAPARVIVEADGGSRGNPGRAAYGAVLRDAVTGAVLGEACQSIGVETNNVAEYRGLIAGLQLAGAYAPDATVEVRMDSRLVIEQMAGRWKIKHPAMRPLAVAARALARRVELWTWIPREQNKAADTLVNAALDGLRDDPPPSLARAQAARGAQSSTRSDGSAADDAGDSAGRLF
jgi:ribonuclease HI